MRIGNFRGEEVMPLESGSLVSLIHTTQAVDVGTRTIPVAIPDLVSSLRPGNHILLDDGKIRLVVVEKKVVTDSAHAPEAVCSVVAGGVLSSRKGIHTPDVLMHVAPLTPWDMECVKELVKHDVDYIALSFVQRARDMALLRSLIPNQKGPTFTRPMLIAKIEKPSAVEDIEEILRVSDGIMVARGDLGVECTLVTVPGLQKKLIERANRHGKVVITATEMLQSMIESTTPSRAEVSDVANAVCDGTDAVMLSGETAAGKHPVNVVKYMSEICIHAEKLVVSHPRTVTVEGEASSSSSSSHHVIEESQTMMDIQRHFHHNLARAAVVSGRQVDIIACLSSGYMARLLSKQRPTKPIVVFTTDVWVHRRLALWWGVLPLYLEITKKNSSTKGILNAIVNELLERKIVGGKDTMMLVCGNVKTAPALSNSLRLFSLEGIAQPP
eukprot:PhF_6_TR39715/c0_g1_i3/m.59095/K00873/PK, pyk; pyruvate kinase